MNEYIYNKKVDPERLSKEILSNGINLSHITTVSETVYIYTISELTQSELQILDSMISSHNYFDLNTVIKKKVFKSIELGQEIMVEFVTENILMGLTDEQMLQTSEVLSEVQRLLASGSLGLAKSKIDLLQPIPVILDQERIEKYSNLIQQKMDEL